MEQKKRIFTISPDYDICISDEEGYVYDCHNDILDLGVNEKDNLIIKVPGIYEWQSEINKVVIASAVGEKSPFDWEEWHKRGVELAKQLRDKLPSLHELWYEAPFEDESGTIKEKFIILNK